jgi:hypothetical protein
MSVTLPFQLPCPQCGALLTLPHRVETFTCPWCGSTLRPGEGVPLLRLCEQVRVTPDQARGAFLAWLSGPETPARMERRTDFEVGTLRYFPFLRVRGAKEERIVALASLPAPELATLGRMPAEMEPGEPAEGGGAPDGEILSREIKAAVALGDVRELRLEYRAYYPVRYSFEGSPYTAFVDAGGGLVHAGRQPARREVVGERGFAAGAMVLLFAIAVLVPGLPLKLIAVGTAAVGLYFLLVWMVGRYG